MSSVVLVSLFETQAKHTWILANEITAWYQDELDEEFQKRLAEHKEAAVTRTDKKRAKRLVMAVQRVEFGWELVLLADQLIQIKFSP